MARGITISILILSLLFISGILLSTYIHLRLSKKKNTPAELLDEIFVIISEPQYRNFVDLGAGDFKLVFMASRLGFNSTGVEISPVLIIKAKFKRFFNRIKATVKQQNMYKTFLRDYDVIYINQQANLLPKLAKKITLEAKNNAEIYLFDIEFPGKEPTKQFQLSDNRKLNKYTASQFKDGY